MANMNETFFYREPRDEQHPFTRMPKALMYDKRLSFRDRIVMGTILDNADTWKLNISEIGRRLGMSKHTLKEASQKLQDTGWLKKTKTGFGKYRWEIFESPQGPKTAPLFYTGTENGPTKTVQGPKQTPNAAQGPKMGSVLESKPATQGLNLTPCNNWACKENNNKGEHLLGSKSLDGNNDILNIFSNDKEEDYTLTELDKLSFNLIQTNTLLENKDKMEKVMTPYEEDKAVWSKLDKNK